MSALRLAADGRIDWPTARMAVTRHLSRSMSEQIGLVDGSTKQGERFAFASVRANRLSGIFLRSSSWDRSLPSDRDLLKIIFQHEASVRSCYSRNHSLQEWNCTETHELQGLPVNNPGGIDVE
jgi:hypothetical protein